MNPPRLKAYLLLLIVGVIWGVAGPVIKLTLKDLPPDIFLIYRFFLASLVALPFLLKKSQKPKTFHLWILSLVYGFLNSAVTLGLLFWGTDMTSLIDMSLISLFGPIMMVVLGFIFLKEHITAKEKVGSLIAFLGAFVIAIEPILIGGYKSGAIIGNVLIFLSLVTGAVSGLLAKKLMRENISPFFLTNFSFVIGFLSLLPLLLLSSPISHTLSTIRSTPILSHLGVFYIAFISGTVAYTLNNLAQKTIELSEAALFAYIYPLFSAILAIYFLGETIGKITIIGSIITGVGIVIAEIKKKRYN